uniref:Protein PtsT n=1 Tax=Geobacillus stearothermophilus TaxID=1422 RepID=PTST_GEOSE|nr:RecName: Full=Protein PtsT [Geobacillus stearothermophilus]AAA86050.1 PtsT [Geobacillus stearothermophilus]
MKAWRRLRSPRFFRFALCQQRRRRFIAIPLPDRKRKADSDNFRHLVNNVQIRIRKHAHISRVLHHDSHDADVSDRWQRFAERRARGKGARADGDRMDKRLRPDNAVDCHYICSVFVLQLFGNASDVCRIDGLPERADDGQMIRISVFQQRADERP